jgi:hypothetical protein
MCGYAIGAPNADFCDYINGRGYGNELRLLRAPRARFDSIIEADWDLHDSFGLSDIDVCAKNVLTMHLYPGARSGANPAYEKH